MPKADRHAMMMTLMQVALGGAIGAAGRYLVGVAATRVMGLGFPWGTLTVNVAGSFLMGVLVVSLAHKDATRLAPFLMTGVLGGFTTFSSFSLETMRLWQNGMHLTGLLYILLNNMISIGLCYLGYWAGKSFSL